MNFVEFVRENILRSRDLGGLPENVREILKARERANEILVRVVQVAILSLFSTLYLVAAKPVSPSAFQPVPMVLGAYLLLSIIGLVWSIRRKLPDWSVYCSILFDFGLLYALMISFHYQYQQPASFILKAPTLLYVFIFIALRALRLEWKFVAAAGVTAALGWLLIIFYVINVDPEQTMITRSYVEYLTSNTILIGAEVDKIISILAVTALLALAVNSSSNLLVTAVSEQDAARSFSRFFDRQIAQNIRSSGGQLEAGRGERRTMAIVNIDIRGFSKLAANREPSEVMQILSIYQGRVVPILQEKGAIIDKFMGDGIMATFGIEDSDANCSRPAIEAVEELLIDRDQWQSDEPVLAAAGATNIGIGIATGTVAFGAVGEGNRLEMTVIGSPVNTSAKLEKHNKVLGTTCIVLQETWEDAVQNGYKGKLQAELLESNVEGIEAPQQIAILSLRKKLDAPVTKSIQDASKV